MITILVELLNVFVWRLKHNVLKELIWGVENESDVIQNSILKYPIVVELETLE